MHRVEQLGAWSSGLDAWCHGSIDNVENNTHIEQTEFPRINLRILHLRALVIVAVAPWRGHRQSATEREREREYTPPV